MNGKGKHPGGRPPLYDSVEELESVIQSYFVECDIKEVPYGVEGLALALGMDRRTLLNYEERPEFLPTIKAAKQKVRSHVEGLMLQGKVGTGAIFWLKNNAGWKDESTTELKGNLSHTHKREMTEEDLLAIASGSSTGSP